MSAALLTVSEAAATLRVGRTTLYRMFADGDIAWVQVGAHRRVAVTEISRFIDAHTQVAS